MAQTETQMWKYWSRFLDGFYASWVIVQGRDKAEAVDNAMKAIEAHLQEHFDRFGGNGSFSVEFTREGPKGSYTDRVTLDPSEEDFDELKAEALAAARAEAEQMLEPVEHGRLVLYSL